MLTVRIIPDWNYSKDNLFRQTINNSGVWGDIRFTLDPIDECDVVIFINRIKNDEKICCRKGGRILLQMEPPSPAHRWYRASDIFFDKIVGPDKKSDRKKRIFSHGAVPWKIDMSYDELIVMKKPEKYREISMITSDKNFMNGHEFRINLISELRSKKNHFDLFGRGFNEIENKTEALLNYKYSIVVENSFYPYYWTEKIVDCLLTYTIPIYIGAKNITDFFPEKSFVSVAPDVNKIIKTIKNIKEHNFDDSHIEKARMLILDQYQFFPFISKIIKNIMKRRELGEKKEYIFIRNDAPGEGRNEVLYRKIEYKLRKFLKIKPY